MRKLVHVLFVSGFAVTLLGAAAQPASAGAILSPVTATASNTTGGDILHTIDQTGLSPTFISGVSDFDTYIAGGPTHVSPDGSNAWAGTVAALPIDLDFGLGGTYSIGDLALWTSYQGFSINRFTVFTANNAGFVGAVNVGSFDANDTLPPMAAQIFSLAPSVGSFLRLEILSDEGAPSVNLAEIGVEVSPAAVPEPASLLLLGTGLAAVARRRLRRR
jgi:PEP-CTERM motif-containing protein